MNSQRSALFATAAAVATVVGLLPLVCRAEATVPPNAAPSAQVEPGAVATSASTAEPARLPSVVAPESSATAPPSTNDVPGSESVAQASPDPNAGTAPTPTPPVAPSAIDATLQGAAEDLGLSLHQLVLTEVLAAPEYLNWEKHLQTPPHGKVTLGAILSPVDQGFELRLVLVRDDGISASITAPLDNTEVEVTTVRALNQLSQSLHAKPLPEHTVSPGRIVNVSDTSEGKATLAATGALLGGYLGFAIENVGGSAEAALVYPLVALGSGVGLAGALIAAEEWPVNKPRAWYISGGGIWLTAAAVFIASDQQLAHPTERYPYGLIGTGLGLGIASFVSSQRTVTEPEALLSNEGGAFGTLAGGLVHRLIVSDNTHLPALGMGLGGATGWLVAGLVGPHVLPDLSSSRVLFAGLGGSIGALTGAAVASPALVKADRREPKKEGVLFASALGGLVLGSVVGYWFGESDTADPKQHQALNLRRIGARLNSTQAQVSASPYGLTLPGTTNLTLQGQW